MASKHENINLIKEQIQVNDKLLIFGILYSIIKYYYIKKLSQI